LEELELPGSTSFREILEEQVQERNLKEISPGGRLNRKVGKELWESPVWTKKRTSIPQKGFAEIKVKIRGGGIGRRTRRTMANLGVGQPKGEVSIKFKVYFKTI